MVKKYQISIFLDTRHQKEGKLFPVKLRVYMPETKKARLFPTKFDLTEKDFNSAVTIKPRTEFKDLRLKLQALEQHANEVAEKTNPFSFALFKKRMGFGKNDGQDAFFHYRAVIQSSMKEGRIGSSSSYEQSLKSLQQFLVYKNVRDAHTLGFSSITQEWLKDYERYMVKVKKLTTTTVGIYLRALRAVFNSAILAKDISQDLYPFGKNKHRIPTGNNIKKAMPFNDLRILRDAKAGTPEQKKARDFFFFSYASNGMNIKDITLLKNKDFDGEAFRFLRAKTINTAKEKRHITCYLTPFTSQVIKDYGNSGGNPNDYIFNIINDNLTDLEKHSAIKKFTRFVNQHVKTLAVANGLTIDISSYWARHSWASNAITEAGQSMEFVMEALGHSNPTTTMNYFAGFDDKAKKGVTDKLMDF